MQSVLFLIYHGLGHFNACFQMAKILKKDHEVVFAGAEFFKAYIESQGFIFYPLKSLPFGLGFEKWINEQEKKSNIYFNTVKDRWTDRLYKLREDELLRMMDDIYPDYLLTDSFQATDFIILYPHLKFTEIKIGLVQTMLPTTIKKNCPPLNSLALPDDETAVRNALTTFRLNRIKKQIKQKIQYAGMDDAAIVNRRIRKNKIPRRFISTTPDLNGFALQLIDELILAPSEFDFIENKSTHQQYIGFMPDFGRMEISDVEYFKVDASIRSEVRNTGAKLIYCSFGSFKSEHTPELKGFIDRLVDVMRNKNIILIISLHAIGSSQLIFDKLPANVYMLKAAPQLQILERADLFITHGGLNSIKESIYNEVPMLVYPLHDKTDSNGNSARVVYHGLGLRGDLRKDTSDDIHKKITALVTVDQYKKNIVALKTRDGHYTEKFMACFKKLRPANQY